MQSPVNCSCNAVCSIEADADGIVWTCTACDKKERIVNKSVLLDYWKVPPSGFDWKEVTVDLPKEGQYLIQIKPGEYAVAYRFNKQHINNPRGWQIVGGTRAYGVLQPKYYCEIKGKI